MMTMAVATDLPAHPVTEPELESAHKMLRAVSQEISRVVMGQRDTLETLLLAILARGHVLIEGVPGTGKTLIVKSLTTTIQCGFRRVQMTPDLMPADITGSGMLNP